MGFAADITSFCNKTGLKADVVLRKIGLDALAGLILMSPVDTGRFRGSWRIGIDQTDLTTLPADFNRKRDNGMAETARQTATNNGTAAIGKAKFGQTILLTNNVPYGPKLEGGSSTQAPDGVVRPTFIRIKAGLSRLVA